MGYIEDIISDLMLFTCREVWPDRVEFRISSDAPEDEFLALREICLLNFPGKHIKIFITTYSSVNNFSYFMVNNYNFD